MVAFGRVPPGLAAVANYQLDGNDAELSRQFGTAFSRRGDPNYEIWRQSMIWQRRKSARFPDLIVQAKSVPDVIAAVKYASRHGLRITARCGGHSMAACFLRDRGMLLDVSQLQGVEIDAAHREAWAGPGVMARGFNQVLREAGLAFPTAHCGTVPLGGFLLGGGIGLNGNLWGGMSVFNIKSAEVVTADGVLRRVSATENPDLFWAVRGGGPGLFGVVTRFELQLYELPKAVVSTTLSYGFTDLRTVAQALSEIAPRTHRDVEILVYIGRAEDDLARKLADADAQLAVHLQATSFVDSLSTAQQRTRRLLEHPIVSRAIARHVNQLTTIEKLYFEAELGFSQRRWQGDNVFTSRLPEVAKVLEQRMPECPAADSQALIQYKGNPKLPDAACSTIDDFYAAFYSIWDNHTEDTRNHDYLLSLYRELAPLGTSSNINEMNQEGRRKDIARCYSPDAWRRLAELRAKWDPQRVFHDFYGLS
jgi:FAD/FMN-containing dehydrogenase